MPCCTCGLSQTTRSPVANATVTQLFLFEVTCKFVIKLPANAQCSFTTCLLHLAMYQAQDVIGIVWLLAMLVYKEHVHIPA